MIVFFLCLSAVPALLPLQTLQEETPIFALVLFVEEKLCDG